MSKDKQIFGLVQLAQYIKNYLNKKNENFESEDFEFQKVIKLSEIENPWFTENNICFALEQWANLFTEDKLQEWLADYRYSNSPKKIGLILAGNIPLVGFHDVLCVVLSGNIPLIKQSSKDKRLLPFLLEKWNGFSENNLVYHWVEKLENYDAVIATGSNNTAKYLEYYFRDTLAIIRKNRTSVAVLSGTESDEELQLLATDVFTYFGLGCRNVSRLFLPKEMQLDRVFENFVKYGDIINHHSYANNYDYNKAIYLLNQDLFWDNNFVMLKEDEHLFSPLSVLNFSRYGNLDEVKEYLTVHNKEIQCVVADPKLGLPAECFGEAQKPKLNTYADHLDTMRFLETV